MKPNSGEIRWISGNTQWYTCVKSGEIHKIEILNERKRREKMMATSTATMYLNTGSNKYDPSLYNACSAGEWEEMDRILESEEKGNPATFKHPLQYTKVSFPLLAHCVEG
jgi:hypothetical protein